MTLKVKVMTYTGLLLRAIRFVSMMCFNSKAVPSNIMHYDCNTKVVELI